MEDRFFFNPYNFPPSYVGGFPPNMMPSPNISQNMPANSKTTPKEFYENQYYYYRYLNEFMDYQIKSHDFSERLSKNNKTTQN